MGLRQASTTYELCPEAENKLAFGKVLAKEVVPTGQISNRLINFFKDLFNKFSNESEYQFTINCEAIKFESKMTNIMIALGPLTPVRIKNLHVRNPIS